MDVNLILKDALERVNHLKAPWHFPPGPAYRDDLSWYAWPQLWADTSSGFGGVAGQMITNSQCVVVALENLNYWLVYHGGRFAYMVRQPNDHFIESMRNWNLPGRDRCRTVYLSRLGREGVYTE